ncbi:toprim domain-containing protein [Arthrobacter rhombi]|uniref:toprim domain-containing protein n=1 Tax=Arthrobacter rhombi TaxID=71253 RepID=UPI003FD0890F
MKLSDLLSRLAVDREQPGGWLCFCPAHDDVNSTSLSVRKLDNGRLWLHCFAGCEYDAILSALELTRGDLRTMNDDEPTVKPAVRAASELAPGQVAALQARADAASAALLEDADALVYIADRWGASPEDAARLGLGLVDDGGGRVLVTLRDADGVAVSAQGRAIHDDVQPKWDGDLGSGYWRAGFLGPVSGNGPVIVSEGPGDGIVAALAGYDVVAVLGATSGAAVARLADSLKGREVYVAGDNDDAGRRFDAKVAEVISGSRPLPVPAAHNDLADWREADSTRFLQELQQAMTTTYAAEEVKNETSKKPAKVTPEDIMDHILRAYSLHRSVDGIGYAVPTEPGRARIARELSGMGATVSAEIWRTYRKVPSTSSLVPAALATAKGIAGDCSPEQISLRAALLPGREMIQVDLGDDTGAYVEITANGWTVRPTDYGDPRAVFRRPGSTMPLPTPQRGGGRDQLRELLGLDADDPHWRLIWGWLIGVWFEGFDRPILWLTGTQGSGKTTRARMILDLVDPAASLSSEPGKNQNDDVVAALNRFIPSYDNVSKVSQATSDMLCRLVTGANIDKRALYSDDDMRARYLKRAPIATSLDLPYGLQSDAIERTLHVDFPAMNPADRRPESEIRAEFETARGAILGAIFDDVVGVLQTMDSVRSGGRTLRLERLADYSVVMHSLDVHLGYPTESGYAEAFRAAVSGGMLAHAEGDPVLSSLRRVIAKGNRNGNKNGPPNVWGGTMGDLATAVAYDMEDNDPSAGSRPLGSHRLRSILQKNTLALEALGIIREPSGKNRVVFRLAEDDVPEVAGADSEAEGQEPPREVFPRSGGVGGADLDDLEAA